MTNKHIKDQRIKNSGKNGESMLTRDNLLKLEHLTNGSAIIPEEEGEEKPLFVDESA